MADPILSRPTREGISISVADALGEYIADLRLEQRTGSARTYARTLVPLVRLELDSVAHLTPSVCRELMVERSAALAASSLTTFYSVLRSFCRWCVERRGYLSTNPTDGIPKPKQKRSPHRWLTGAQLRAMYDACKDDTERLVLLLCGGSGLRAQELLTLAWENVDYDRGEIRVLGKGRKYRTLAPGALAMAALKTMADTQKPPSVGGSSHHQSTQSAGLVSHGSSQELPADGTGLSAPIVRPAQRSCQPHIYVMPYRTTDTLGYHVEKIAKRAGVGRCHPHKLRHSFAVNYLQADGTAYGLQQLLGHASPLMTQFYTRSASEDLARREQGRVDLAARLFGALAGDSVPA